jgi:hypothetical protein
MSGEAYLNRSRLKAFWLWLIEGPMRYVWSLALLVVVAGLFLRLRGVNEPSVRLVGLVSQVLGIATVAWGAKKTREDFGYPSLTSRAMEWLKRFPLRRRDVVLAADTGGMLAMAGKLRAFGTVRPANQTTEARLDAVEKNIKAIHDRISGTQDEMDRGFSDASEALKREERTRAADDSAIREKLAATATGGLYITLIGAALLLVGVVLSTASPEIAARFK